MTRRWRKEVGYRHPDGWVEIGIVNYPNDTQPDRPTVFISAYLPDDQGRSHFERVCREIIRRLNTKPRVD